MIEQFLNDKFDLSNQSTPGDGNISYIQESLMSVEASLQKIFGKLESVAEIQNDISEIKKIQEFQSNKFDSILESLDKLKDSTSSNQKRIKKPGRAY